LSAAITWPDTTTGLCQWVPPVMAIHAAAPVVGLKAAMAPPPAP
jgi:hypothetical protein